MDNLEPCWTCRLRRKKCDKHKPVCHVCSVLLITCHYNPERPDWMDGGSRQQQMTELLKLEVRDKRPYRQSLAIAATSLQEPIQDRVSPSLPAHDPTILGAPSASSPDSFSGFRSPATDRPPITNPNLPGVSPITPAASCHSIPSRGDSLKISPTGLDQGLIVCYLDFYFPFLFPFYQPPMLDRGRAWIIDIITDSKAMEQTTLSLSSYFFSLSLDTAQDPAHNTCRKLSWQKLLEQIHETFTLLRVELQCLLAEGVSEHLPKAVRTIGCILLLQRFETAISGAENYEAHLSGAIEVFRQLMESPVKKCDPSIRESKFASIMRQLRGDGPPWPRQFMTFAAPSSDQMAFYFFSALLLVDDIIASTALGEEPRLNSYHDGILGNDQWPEKKDDEVEIRLENFIGCQNWAMVAIADISALDAWKRRQKVAGDLDVMELVLRATTIKNILIANLGRIDITAYGDSVSTSSIWDIYRPCNGQPSDLAAQKILITRIWAHAAALYLSVVISGWQPTSSEVRHHVCCILELLSLRTLSWAVLRTIAWPFCVAGCLALPAQEPLLRCIVDGLLPPGLLGPLKQALDIMESVWKQRDSPDSSSLDLVACLRGLWGHVMPLV